MQAGPPSLECKVRNAGWNAGGFAADQASRVSAPISFGRGHSIMYGPGLYQPGPDQDISRNEVSKSVIDLLETVPDRYREGKGLAILIGFSQDSLQAHLKIRPIGTPRPRHPLLISQRRTFQRSSQHSAHQCSTAHTCARFHAPAEQLSKTCTGGTIHTTSSRLVAPEPSPRSLVRPPH